jgi:hypothetical protein
LERFLLKSCQRLFKEEERLSRHFWLPGGKGGLPCNAQMFQKRRRKL